MYDDFRSRALPMRSACDSIDGVAQGLRSLGKQCKAVGCGSQLQNDPDTVPLFWLAQFFASWPAHTASRKCRNSPRENILEQVAQSPVITAFDVRNKNIS